MARSRVMNFVVVLSVITSSLFNAIPLAGANASLLIKATPFTNISKKSSSPLNNVLKHQADTSVATIKSPITSQGSIPANSQDIAYLVGSSIIHGNVGNQVGRTRNFSSSSPNWTSAGGLPGIMYDFILDPSDPYYTAWAVGDNGIWRTTNLDNDPPTWNPVLSMNQITTSLTSLGAIWYPSSHGVVRISGDASRPGYFFVVLDYEAAPSGLGYQPPWIGWTTNNGNTWSWQYLPKPKTSCSSFGLGFGGSDGPSGLSVSQDGSGQVWLGASDCSFHPNLLYSANYGQTWNVVWWDNAKSNSSPRSLYYARGALYLAIFNTPIGRSLDKGNTWTFNTTTITPTFRLHYGISGLPQTNQLVYYIDQNEALQYSVDGGTTFALRSQGQFTENSAVVSWLDNPNQIAWARRLCAGSGIVGCGSAQPIMKYSIDGGTSWVDKTGDWYSQFNNAWWGANGTSQSYGNVFILVPSQVQYLRDLYLKGKLCDCNITTGAAAHDFANDPIDTSNGNLSYQVKDISVPSLGNNMSFQRSYASSSNNLSSTLGYGWVSNFDTRIVATNTVAQPITVALQTSNGSQLLFFHTISDTYAPDFGVTAYLTRTASGNTIAYTLTDKSQTVYTFNMTGSLISKRDPVGHITTYSYTLPNTLTHATDVGTGRWLKFNYDGSNRLISVTDNINRSIGFTYDITGDLTTFTDTRGLPWTYTYTSTHLLWKVIDPDTRIVIRTEYDNQGRAIQQFDGANNKTVELNFGNGITTTLTDALGNPSTDTYAQGKWINSLNAAGSVITRSYDLNFRPTYLADANGNGTQMQWSPDGANLEKIIYSPEISVGQIYSPVLGITLTIYAAGISSTQQYDALNNLTQITDTRDFITSFTYSGTLLTKQINALGNTTIYTYGQNNLLIAQQDALGHITQYGYDAFGQRIAITDALQNVTRYAYDGVGRLITTTDALGRMTINAYDKADHLLAVTNNYTSTSTQPNYLNAYNLITQYAYDGSGRQIFITDTLGHVSRNGYDAASRLISATANYSPTVWQNYSNTYNLITQYGYDKAGNQILVTDTLTHVTKTDYDSLNRPITVTSNYVTGVFTSTKPDQDIIRITTYDPVGNVTAQTDALGRVTHTWYDNLNRVISVSANYSPTVGQNYLNTYNLITQYGYDEASNQLLVTDTLGHVTRNYVDPLNRIISTTVNYTAATSTPNYLNQYNLITRYGYDQVGNRIVLTDPLGNPTYYAYDVLNRVMTTTNALSGKSVTQYDAIGNRIKSIDALTHTQVYTYDLAGRLSMMQDASGSLTQYAYDALGRTVIVTDALMHTTRTFYDAAGRVVSTTNALTGTTVITYDALGRRVGFINENDKSSYSLYDGLGRTIAVTDATGIALYTVYDALGNRLKSIDALGHTTVYTYDTDNRLVAQADALSNVTRYQYDPLGNRLVMTDANSVATGYGYDALNRLSIVTESMTTTAGLNPNAYNLTTIYKYDPVGNRTVMTNARGYTMTYIYDALYRLTSLSDPLSHTTRYKYDAVGNQVIVTDANLTTTVYLYDAMNRPLIITYTADAKTVKYAYDKVGSRTFMTDSLGVTRYVYDALNRPIVITDPYTGTITYTYDLVGNHIGLIYPDGKVITSTYDAANRLLTIKNWSNQVMTYTYDAAGRLITTTLPNGVKSINAYDNADRLIRLNTNSPVSGTLGDYQYVLDAVGNRIAVTETTYHATTPIIITGTSTFSVLTSTDDAYIETSSQWIDHNDSHTIMGYSTSPGGNQYWNAGYRINAVTLPASASVINAQLILMASNTDTSTVGLYAYGEASASPATYSTYSNFTSRALTTNAGSVPTGSSWTAGQDYATDVTAVVSEVMGYWANGNPMAFQTSRLVPGQQGPLVPSTNYIRQAYTYEGSNSTNKPARLVLTYTYPATSTLIRYTYDPLSRLTSAAYSGLDNYSFAYAYDKVGNRTAQTSTITSTQAITYTYDNANRMSKVGTTNYTWDNNGNLTNDGSTLYRYDQANRMISTTLSGATTLFNYNGDGMRLKQVIAGVPTTYTQDLAVPLPVVLQAKTGTVATQYLFSMGTRPIAQYTSSAWQYLLADGLGSVRQIVDASGNIALTESYEPYGKVLSSSGSATSMFGYAGEEADSSGLIYLRARYMNPMLGIFTTRDPWSGDQVRPGSMNGFNYADSNPVIYTDPSGHFICFAGPAGFAICVIAGIVTLISGGCNSAPEGSCPALPDDIQESPLERMTRQTALTSIQVDFNIHLPPNFHFEYQTSGAPNQTGETPWFDQPNWRDVTIFEWAFGVSAYGYGSVSSAYDIAGVMVHEAYHAWQEYSIMKLAEDPASAFKSSNTGNPYEPDYNKTAWLVKHKPILEWDAFTYVEKHTPTPLCRSKKVIDADNFEKSKYSGPSYEYINGINSVSIPMVGEPLQ